MEIYYKGGDILEEDRILEIAGIVLGRSEESVFNIPNDENIDIAQLTADDDNPMFVNVEIIRNGQSGNNRVYDDNIVRIINDMVPGTMGYLGHPDPGKTGFEFRDPQCIYVGSQVVDMDNGVIASIGKAYIFKTSPLREWIPKSMIAGNPMTVSINAYGDIYNDPSSDAKYVKNINRLESIDWANPGTEGFSSSTAISVVKEMKEEEGDNIMGDSRENIVKGVSLAEIKAYNPDITTGLLKDVTVTELKKSNPALYDSIVESNRITEVKLVIGGEEKSVKLDEIQELINKGQDEVSKLNTKISEIELKATKDKLISEMVPEQYVDKILPRVIGNNEKEIKECIESELSYITEIADVKFDNLPKGNTQRKSQNDNMEESIKKLFGVQEDNE